MKIPTVIAVLAALGPLAHPAAVRAALRDTWLQGPKLPIASGSTVRFELTTGDSFPTLDQTIRPDRIEREGVRVGGMTRRFEQRKRTRHGLGLQASLAVEGVAVAFVSLKATALDRKHGQVEEYLDAMGLRRRAGGEEYLAGKRWRELQRLHAKTFLRVGKTGGGTTAWAEPVGQELEIIPERDPTVLRPGDVLPVVVLDGGRPLADVAIAATDGTERTLRRTDASGRAAFLLDRPGRWLLAGSHLRRTTRPDLDWESDFTTLTVQVGWR
jgi:uncharacterized GH25 family protein